MADDQLHGVPLLVYANKQDLPNARSTSEITQRLGLEQLRGREWLVQGCSATSGDGLLEGLEWLSQAVKRALTAGHPAAAPAPTMDAISSDNPNVLAVKAVQPSAAPDVIAHDVLVATPVPPSKPDLLAHKSPSAAGEPINVEAQSQSESVTPGSRAPAESRAAEVETSSVV